MMAPADSMANIPSTCTSAPVTITRERTINTRASLADPFVFLEADDFRFTLGHEDTFKLLKARIDNNGEDDLQLRVLAFLLNSLPVKDHANDVAQIWPDLSQLKGNELQLAENVEHEIAVLFLHALREGSATVERTGNGKQVTQLNVQMYEARAVQGVRFISNNQKAFDYCQLISE